MLQKLLISFILLFNANSLANQFNYQADVKGMVCAFCAYNVSKNISSLPGVDAGSVNVDLLDGLVTFNSSQIVSEKKLTAVFSDSGFTLSNLRKSKDNKTVKSLKQARPSLTLQLDRSKTKEYKDALEAIGNIVASRPSYLIINAPQGEENNLLKPILMGRQQVIKIRYIPEETEIIDIQLFAEQ